jgi:hypothetical protein
VADLNAKQILEEMASMVTQYSTAPSFEDMPRRTLADKMAAGPTSAHVIEEIHTPFNIAYTTFTTGSTAFQNIVGVTYTELPARASAGKAALVRAGAVAGDKLLVCYPPLVNVFSKGAFYESGIEPLFLTHSSRDAALVAMCQLRPQLVIGESSFLRTALEDAKKLGIWDLIPEGLALLCAGSPLDMELLPLAEEKHARVHDLYGCQEFGWIAMDGVPLRKDVVLLPEPSSDASEWVSLVVGGMPTGDSFPKSADGHVLNSEGSIISYGRRRSNPELTVIVRDCTAASPVTVERVTRTILRTKSVIVHVGPDLKVGASANRLELKSRWPENKIVAELFGPEQTTLFDNMVEAQEQLQGKSKNDPVWVKRS